uniref:Large ribosomal subunit protein uL18c n=1 Tax=Compsopogon caeruleus TaxID=31354 RepID=A0A1Z1XB46_9RHOD|nr:LSU ribosomal protein L18p [Compsopogon caeruleus]ARX96091.1 LSU ribosomal protein L18p [Compsopogon caeruleus]
MFKEKLVKQVKVNNIMNINRKSITAKKHTRIRHKINGTQERPRLAVFRSNQHIYVQVINDVTKQTLVSSSTKDKNIKNTISSGNNCEAASIVGKIIATKSISLGITKVVFDRGGKC